MKKYQTPIKYLTLMLCVTYFTNFLCAQTFINPGAEWNFKNTVSGGNYVRYEQWKYESDTVINNFNYNKINKRIKSVFSDNGPINSSVLQPFLFRSSGDSLIIANIDGNNERLLYDFTPLIGNTWEADPFLVGFTINPSSSQMIRTVNFGDTLINGYTVNWIEVESQNPDSLIFSGRIHNHFGMQQMFPFWDDGTLDIVPSFWQCYKDDLIGEIGLTPCIDFETLSLENIHNCNFKINTDEINNQLIISREKCQSEFTLFIFDLSGKLIISKAKIKTNAVELLIPKGLYICRIQSESNTFIQKFAW